MKKGLTELVFILDRSGSMGGLESDTIGGFNGMIRKQKLETEPGKEAENGKELKPGKVSEKGEAASAGDTLVSVVLFDDKQEVLFDRVPLDKVPDMTDKDYYVRGCTALLDAVGDAVHHIRNVHKYAREEDRPEKTLFVITTDGMENASRRYNYADVQKMVQHEQEKYGWEFLFLGANMDAISTARSFGIRADRAVRYECDGAGTALNFDVVGKTIAKARKGRAIEADWCAEIVDDYEKRGK